jgi:diaminohydroxyphosphoribosylaminopyrimidine deaminase/5-amino-6-(5-phosphoribosylamino)uracil reductase
MRRCFELAVRGAGSVAPNPMVGAVIVYDNKIIGEGFHEKYGQAHAEPNAINSVNDSSLLKKSTLYVNLEPCSHIGKTPPCAALIIEKQIPRVVIANGDPNPKVAGRGIRMLQEAGIEVVTGVLEQEGRELNRRFFCFHEKHRPYIILKWAQSSDGFIDKLRNDRHSSPVQFSTPETQQLNQQLRTEEAAILVGTHTVLLDNPRLTNRSGMGKNPLRIAIDRNGKIPADFHLLDDSIDTLIFTEKHRENTIHTEFLQLDFSKNIIPQLLAELHRRNILSLVVEGGAKLLQSFISDGLWDEARVETAPIQLQQGVSAPQLAQNSLTETKFFGENKIEYFRQGKYSELSR